MSAQTFGRGEAAIFAGVFAASRLLYLAAGIHFDDGTLDFYWQFLDPQLLRSDLWRSVLHLHSQPPLFNLFLGAVLHLPLGLAHRVFHAAFAACGLALGLALLALAARLGVPRWLRLPAVALFLVAPAAILTENLLFYTYPVMAALALAALALHRFASGGRRADGLAFFGLLAAIALTQSLFHLLFIALAAAGVALAVRPLRRRTLAAALPLLVVALWYGRSAMLFGTFSASSWLGMSLAKVATKLLPTSERRAFFAEDPAEAILAVEPFSPVDDYAGIALPPPTGVPALDRPTKSTGAPNLNHLAYLDLSRRYLAATAALVRRHPSAYLRGTGAAWLVYLRSPADSAWLRGNRLHVARVSRWLDRLLYWQPAPFTGELGPAHVAWAIALLLPLALVHGVLFARRALAEGDLPGAATVLFLVFTIVYVAVVGNSAELGENNRFRFETEPLALVLLLLLAQRLRSHGRGSAGFPRTAAWKGVRGGRARRRPPAGNPTELRPATLASRLLS